MWYTDTVYSAAPVCSNARERKMGDHFAFPRRHARRTVVPLVFLVVIASGSVLAECPVSRVFVRGEECCSGKEVFNLTSDSTAPTNGISYGSSSAKYNLREGRLEASAHVYEAHKHTSGVVTADVFTLTGVPAATITIRADLSYAAVTDPSWRMAWISGLARLEVGGLSVETSGTYPIVERSVELQIDVLEGEPFTLVYTIEAAGWGYYPTLDMGCTLSFPDLPAGAEITSCNGYGETEVPVESTTWGAIKSLYR
jgi:hypothetical protein